jgi:alpha-L-fucosidase
VWHDGANGGDGYYGGAKEKRIIDKLHYYDWPGTWGLIRELQPNAVIFSDVGPDLRWGGNEDGRAGETCWATYEPHSAQGGPGTVGDIVQAEANMGTRGGKAWMPAECDVSIRPGWFWHAAENGKVKTPRELFELYCVSTGHGASFLLNVPPDRRGLLHEADVASLAGFGQALRSSFAVNLAAPAKAKASNWRGQAAAYGAEHLLDGNASTYWATDDGVTTAEVVFDLPHAVSFDLIRLRERIELGQRVDKFGVDAWTAGAWREIGTGTSIGASRILRPAKTTAQRVRLRITQAAAPPALTEFGLYTAPSF